MTTTPIDLGDSSGWILRDGRLVHCTGGFFSVVSAGLASPGSGGFQCARQPIIDQPEVGILGFIVRQNSDGDVDLLMQAKPEPGNIGTVQLAPSVQATRSNYLRIHGGQPTLHLEMFLSPNHAEIASSLQSEQGSRFLGKYNRNVMVKVRSSDIESSETLRWCSSDSVRTALGLDFTVNTDARSVLVTSPWEALVADRPVFKRSGGNQAFRSLLYDSFHQTEDADNNRPLQMLGKARNDLSFGISIGSLTALPGWLVTSQRINAESDDLSLVHVSVSCSYREVDSWDQPLLASNVEGDVRLLCQQRNGTLQFLFCISPEMGFTEYSQFGPSIQIQGGPKLISPALAERDRIIGDIACEAERQLTVLQSDEGGRFMHCVSRYSIDLIAPDTSVPDLCWATWMPLSTVTGLLTRQGIFTNEARSALSLLLTEL